MAQRCPLARELVCLSMFLETPSEPGNIAEQRNPTWPRHAAQETAGRSAHLAVSAAPFSVFQHLHPTTAYVQTRTWAAVPTLHLSHWSIGTPSPSFPTAPSVKQRPRHPPPPGIPSITLSRCSSPHLPMVSPPHARTTPWRALAVGSHVPLRSDTRLPHAPPSPQVSRSLAAFPGALAEPPRVRVSFTRSWVPP